MGGKSRTSQKPDTGGTSVADDDPAIFSPEPHSVIAGGSAVILFPDIEVDPKLATDAEAILEGGKIGVCEARQTTRSRVGQNRPRLSGWTGLGRRRSGCRAGTRVRQRPRS